MGGLESGIYPLPLALNISEIIAVDKSK